MKTEFNLIHNICRMLRRKRPEASAIRDFAPDLSRFLSFLILSFFLGSAILIPSLSRANPIKLVLNWKPEPQFGGFYEAERLGLFKKQGLDVKIQEGGSGTPTIQMAQAGTADYAIISADELILSYDRGSKDLVAIFAVYQTNPQAIMTHEAKNYSGLEALFQDPKATLLWQSGLPYAQFLLKKFKGPKLKQAPYSGGISSFLADPNLAQQCFFTSEPLSAVEKGAKPKTFLIAEAGYNPYTTVVVVKKSRLEQKPQEVKAMAGAFREAWGSYLRDDKATNQMMAKLNPGMDLESMNKSAKLQRSLIETEDTKKSGLGSMSVVRWQTLSDQLKELKVIQSAIKGEDLFQNL